MRVELHNSWDYDPDERWNWSAYLKGADLKEVSYVQYLLHPSFANPLREVRDPSTNFRMETTSWGPFNLEAIVHFKNGKREILTHPLKLETKPERGQTDAIAS